MTIAATARIHPMAVVETGAVIGDRVEIGPFAVVGPEVALGPDVVLKPHAVVTGRTDPQGQPLDPVLVTRHLEFSLPYRALFDFGVRPDTVSRLIDALVVLLGSGLTGGW